MIEHSYYAEDHEGSGAKDLRWQRRLGRIRVTAAGRLDLGP
jgi:hypothetical protein